MADPQAPTSHPASPAGGADIPVCAGAVAAGRAAAPRRRQDPRHSPLGKGTPGPLGDSLSTHTLSNGGPVVVRRTARRKTGLAAFWEDGQAVIAVPARLSIEDETYWVPRMVSRLEQGAQKLPGARRGPAGDEALMQRSLALSARYLGGRAVPESVRWVNNQSSRWGSATPARKSIRISHHVQGMPDWVIDYVLLHELAHLIHPNHSPDFWQELASYPRLEAARAFLDGASFASARNITGMERSMDSDGRQEHGSSGGDPDWDIGLGREGSGGHD